MMYFKGCPKCQGDLYLGEDIHGQYLSCIQCGHLSDLTVDGVQAPVSVAFVIEAPKTVKKTRKKIHQTA